MKRYFFLALVSLLLMASSCQQKNAATAAPATAPLAEALPDAPFDTEVPPATISDALPNRAVSGPALVYLVDKEASRIAWEGREILTRHNGTIGINGGKLLVVGERLAGGKVEIDMNSIVNLDITKPEKNADLVNHLKSDDFFGVQEFPTAALEILEVKSTDGGKFLVTANLTLRDVTNLVVFPASISIKNNQLAATAIFSIDRSKWNVRFNSSSFFENLGDEAILDEIKLAIELRATAPPTAMR
ncbi:MAG: YceI family protein [Bacteroidetes bacterium]|nr:MAG: YceI family protein [Bacteroidota bacterium]